MMKFLATCLLASLVTGSMAASCLTCAPVANASEDATLTCKTNSSTTGTVRFKHMGTPPELVDACDEGFYYKAGVGTAHDTCVACVARTAAECGADGTPIAKNDVCDGDTTTQINNTSGCESCASQGKLAGVDGTCGADCNTIAGISSVNETSCVGTVDKTLRVSVNPEFDGSQCSVGFFFTAGTDADTADTCTLCVARTDTQCGAGFEMLAINYACPGNTTAQITNTTGCEACGASDIGDNGTFAVDSVAGCTECADVQDSHADSATTCLTDTTGQRITGEVDDGVEGAQCAAGFYYQASVTDAGNDACRLCSAFDTCDAGTSAIGVTSACPGNTTAQITKATGCASCASQGLIDGTTTGGTCGAPCTKIVGSASGSFTSCTTATTNQRIIADADGNKCEPGKFFTAGSGDAADTCTLCVARTETQCGVAPTAVDSATIDTLVPMVLEYACEGNTAAQPTNDTGCEACPNIPPVIPVSSATSASIGPAALLLAATAARFLL